jgi:hypothetical protein
MRYKELVADNEELPIFGEPVRTKGEKFKSFFLNSFIENTSNVLGLDSESRSLFEVQLNNKMVDEVIFDEVEGDLFGILDIANRYLMIKELILIDSKISFGLWGTLFYLGLTCFDSLGQKEKFKTFEQWLSWKENKKVDELELMIRGFPAKNIRSELVELYDSDYKPNYGVKNSFFNFLKRINDTNSFQELLLSIKPSVFVSKQLKEKGWEEDFKKEWLYYFRNNYTHKIKNMRLPIDRDEWKMSYCVKSQSFDIKIRTKVVLLNVLECIKDGIKMKLQQLELL